MTKCLYCYKDLEAKDTGDYHTKCIKAFYGTTFAPALPYRLDEMEKLAKEAVELSITVPGVQPKLSLGWIKSTFGRWAEWPPNRYGCTRRMVYFKTTKYAI